MATHSTIAVEHADGTVSQVYCHWDGYLEHNGVLLEKFYNTREKAEALVALGDISSLDASIECPEGHTSRKSVDGYTVFYGRDNGDVNTDARTYRDFSQYLDESYFEQYNYAFRDGRWLVEIDSKWIAVKDALAKLTNEKQ